MKDSRNAIFFILVIIDNINNDCLHNYKKVL